MNINSADIQSTYTWLFDRMRNYIWDLDVIEMLADVEVDTYDAFIDCEKLRKDFVRLYPIVKSVAVENKDDELLESLDAFQKRIDDSLEENATAYFDLYQVQETPVESSEDVPTAVIEEEEEEPIDEEEADQEEDVNQEEEILEEDNEDQEEE